MQTGAILILIALIVLWMLPLVAAAIVHFLKPPSTHTWIARFEAWVAASRQAYAEKKRWYERVAHFILVVWEKIIAGVTQLAQGKDQFLPALKTLAHLYFGLTLVHLAILLIGAPIALIVYALRTDPLGLLYFLLWTLPVFAGLAAALSRSDKIVGWLDRFTAWLAARREQNREKTGVFHKWVFRPVLATMTYISRVTEKIASPYWRTGARIALFSYFITITLFLLFAAIYVVITIVVGILMILLVLWLLSLSAGGSGSESPARAEPESRPASRGISLFGASTVACRACGLDVSTDADICPHCGENLREVKIFGGSTIRCRACGADISSDAKVCPHCGEPLKEMKIFGGSTIRCRACSAEISSDAEVCPNCGEPLKEMKLFGGSTTSCRACGAKVSTDAKTCPKCGEDLKAFKF